MDPTVVGEVFCDVGGTYLRTVPILAISPPVQYYTQKPQQSLNPQTHSEVRTFTHRRRNLSAIIIHSYIEGRQSHGREQQRKKRTFSSAHRISSHNLHTLKTFVIQSMTGHFLQRTHGHSPLLSISQQICSAHHLLRQDGCCTSL